jgi:hypothetical protein
MKVYGPVSRYQKRQISDALNVGTYTVQRTLKYPRRNRCLTSPHLTLRAQCSAVQCSAAQDDEFLQSRNAVVVTREALI